MKAVICVRTDLKMSTGKIASQCSHASMDLCHMINSIGCKDWKDVVKKWRRDGAKIVILKIKSHSQLREMEMKARSSSIPSWVVIDMGLTEVESGEESVVMIGPGEDDVVDDITGTLSTL